jgi:enterochelin esterase-like enzyme
MKHFIFLTIFLFGLSPSSLVVTQAAPAPSPEIGPNRMVTFRLYAPKAKVVSVDGQWPDGRAAMTRGSDGVWEVTVGPIESGEWEYNFRVDGRQIIDPGNPLIKPGKPLVSILQTANRPPPPPPVLSPEIGTNRMVTFRLRAPDAREVSVDGQWPNGRATMTKDANGVWSVTVGPVEPGVWEYSFQMDGLEMIDPDNPLIKPMRQPTVSILQVRGQPPLPWDLRNVPHGTVHLHTYYSKSLKRFRRLAVYTPPGYEQETRKRFPVLYLQHGYGDNEETWIVHGKANWILDNLIAQGRAKPMIIVMMDGHAALPVESPDSDFLQHNTELFERDLLQDVMPLIAKDYRVKRGPDNRAIAGLSMGGSESLTIGLNHPDLFAWVADFSAATPSSGTISSALENPAKLNRELKLLYIADGKSDFLLERNEGFVALLKEHHIQFEWHLTKGDHTWPVWRKYLTNFVPKLFR